MEAQYGTIAQLVEQDAFNVEVLGSIPNGSTICKHTTCLTVKVMVNYKRQRVRIPGTGSVFTYGVSLLVKTSPQQATFVEFDSLHTI